MLACEFHKIGRELSGAFNRATDKRRRKSQSHASGLVSGFLAPVQPPLARQTDCLPSDKGQRFYPDHGGSPSAVGEA